MLHLKILLLKSELLVEAYCMVTSPRHRVDEVIGAEPLLLGDSVTSRAGGKNWSDWRQRLPK